MKTTAFNVFASCVAIVCLASSPVSKASPVPKSVSGTSENPIVEKQGVRQLHKNLVGQNVVDLKPYDSLLMAVHAPMVLQELHRQRRTYDLEVERRLKKELEGDDSSLSQDSKVPVPEPSNEVQNSQESNEVQNSQESNEFQNSQESNEIQNSQESNDFQGSQQSNEDSQQSSYELPGGLPGPESYESEETEGSYESEENSNDSTSTDDDNEESNKISSTPIVLRTAF